MQCTSCTLFYCPPQRVSLYSPRQLPPPLWFNVLKFALDVKTWTVFSHFSSLLWFLNLDTSKERSRVEELCFVKIFNRLSFQTLQEGSSVNHKEIKNLKITHLGSSVIKNVHSSSPTVASQWNFSFRNNIKSTQIHLFYILLIFFTITLHTVNNQ